MFVWHFNANTFRHGVDKKPPIISWVSQPQRFSNYFGDCTILTQCFYSTVDMGLILFFFIHPFTRKNNCLYGHQFSSLHDGYLYLENTQASNSQSAIEIGS